MQLFKHILFYSFLACILLFICGPVSAKDQTESSFSFTDPIIDGLRISELSPQEAYKLLENQTTSQTISIQGNGSEDSIQLKKVLVNPDPDGQYLTYLLKEKIKQPVSSYIQEQSTTLSSSPALYFDQEKLKQTIESLNCFQEPAYIKMENAEICWDGWDTFVIPEVAGNEPNEEKLIEKISENVSYKDSAIDLEADDLYVKPSITEDSDTIQTALEQIDAIKETEICYNLDDDLNWIDLSDFGDWISIDNQAQISVSTEDAESYLRDLFEDSQVFESRDEALSYNKAFSGYLIDYQKEANALADAILHARSEERSLETFEITDEEVAEKLYEEEKEKLTALQSEYGKTYIYIDIDDQYMWYIKDGKPYVATNITTGTKGEYDTPTGSYEVLSKSTNTKLVGQDYESEVDYWIAFKGSEYGIHDASWRYNYGGTVYLYSGSHGCVNTPYDAVETIYNDVAIGTPVIVE